MKNTAPDFDLRSYLHRQRERINQELSVMLEAPSGESTRLMEAMRYSLMAGGKRLRPILCLAAANAIGNHEDNMILSTACALELVHTYSLIHDDLPAMDNDELRRGKPTCHVIFDEPTAILAGDALLTLAFEILSGLGSKSSNDAKEWLAVIHTVSKAIGFSGMVEGQMRDIAAEGSRLGQSELETMHALKTGALIKASVHTGALLGGGNPEEIARLTDYAGFIGLAFQVVDDILNVEGDPELLGKSVGTDTAHNKGTYPSVLGIDESRVFAAKLIDNALQAIDNFDKRSDPLRALAAYIVERKR